MGKAGKYFGRVDAGGHESTAGGGRGTGVVGAWQVAVEVGDCGSL